MGTLERYAIVRYLKEYDCYVLLLSNESNHHFDNDIEALLFANEIRPILKGKLGIKPEEVNVIKVQCFPGGRCWPENFKPEYALKNMVDVKPLLIRELLNKIEEAENIFSSSASWYSKYNLIFNGEISRKIYEIMQELGLEFENYCDPDTTYQEDLTAYIEALRELKNRICK